MISLLRRHRERVERKLEERRELARLKLIDELFEQINAAEPCPTPDCGHFRGRIHSLSRAKAAPSRVA